MKDELGATNRQRLAMVYHAIRRQLVPARGVAPEEVAKPAAGVVDDLELVGEPRVGDHPGARAPERRQAADVVPVRMGDEDKIGRASCRERGGGLLGGGCWSR